MHLIMKKASAEMLLEGLKGVAGAQEFAAEIHEKIVVRRGTDAQVDLALLMDGAAVAVERIAQEAGDRGVVTQIAAWRRLLEKPREAKITRLGHLEGAIVEWLLDDLDKGWVFERAEGGGLLAHVVESVGYHVSSSREPSVIVNVAANAPSMAGEDGRGSGRTSLSLDQRNLPSTVDQIMSARGWLHETPELHAEYREQARRFREIHAQPNMQFRLAPGTYRRAGRNVNYANSKLTVGSRHRVINDETLASRPIRDAVGRIEWDERVSGGKRRKALPGGPRVISDDAFVEMPDHHLHLIFDLDAHAHAWVPSGMLTEYVYQPEKSGLLVLPSHHRELVDILTADGDVLIEDVVENKSGGTAILLEGTPGLGKTLLAEIYAEIMRRPLYRIQAGQLGTTPDAVAKGLDEVFANAARFPCVVLIDEADIYIRTRDDDLHHNAIVANILLVLEQQRALCFLATNRSRDVDEAIISRCIAVIHFDTPTAEASKAIWRIQADLMGVPITEETIDEIVAHHAGPDGQRASGRDIRALLKLAYRYHRQRGRTVDAELLKQIGAFKRL